MLWLLSLRYAVETMVIWGCSILSISFFFSKKRPYISRIFDPSVLCIISLKLSPRFLLIVWLVGSMRWF